MTLQESQLWYLALAGLGLFEFFKSRRKSWAYIFCLFAAAAVFLESVEGALILIIGVFALLLQNLQAQEDLSETNSRGKKVILSVLSGLIFLSSALKGDIFGLGCLLAFTFLITADWPFRGLLRSERKDDLIETNSKILTYIPVTLLLVNVFTPAHDWVAYVFFAFSFLAFWGIDKDRALFLLFAGMVWLRPELKVLCPVIVLLCLGGRWSSLVLRMFVAYVVATISWPLENETLIGALAAAGVFVGWMTADQGLPQFNKSESNVRDYAFLTMSLLLIAAMAIFTATLEPLMFPQLESLVFLSAAAFVEITKRLAPPLKKLKFEKAFSYGTQDIFNVIPIFKTQEKQKFYEFPDSVRQFAGLATRFSWSSLESRNVGLGIFAIILWSMVVWCYYNI